MTRFSALTACEPASVDVSRLVVLSCFLSFHSVYGFNVRSLDDGGAGAHNTHDGRRCAAVTQTKTTSDRIRSRLRRPRRACAACSPATLEDQYRPKVDRRTNDGRRRRRLNSGQKGATTRHQTAALVMATETLPTRLEFGLTSSTQSVLGCGFRFL